MNKNAKTAVKLVLASLLVGLLMSIFGLTPGEFWRRAADGVVWAWENGLDFLDGAVIYIVTGAAVVVPIFIVQSLANGRFSRKPRSGDKG